MSIIRCYDCDRSIDTDLKTTYTLEQKYLPDEELCEDCALARQDRAEAEELKADLCIQQMENQE